MMALEKIASIKDHRLIIEDEALPAYANHARVIVLWDAVKPAGRRTPPPSLARMGEEKGDIVSGAPDSEWETLG